MEMAIYHQEVPNGEKGNEERRERNGELLSYDVLLNI